jgi:phospho-N-acetylmuramoyl-pentapeptide-transferase
MLIYAGTLLASFVIALVLGWVLIPVLSKLKIGQSIRDVGPRKHMAKAGTPTMGGLIFVLSGVATSMIFMPRNPAGYLVLFMTLAYASVGFADDYLKVVLKQPLGLKARHKLLGQVAAAIMFYIALRALNIEHAVIVPWIGSVSLGLAYPFFVTLVFLATTNSVNLADGVDGLAGGLGIISLLGFALIGWFQGVEGIVFVSLSLVGSILGFMVFNLHPAKVFMGDTGSLAIGGAIAAIAVLLRGEFLLFFLGAIFVVEAISVIIQVFYFKITGRRVFLMSPIHHHFELLGWSEWKIGIWFWSVQAIMTVAGTALWLAAY